MTSIKKLSLITINLNLQLHWIASNGRTELLNEILPFVKNIDIEVNLFIILIFYVIDILYLMPLMFLFISVNQLPPC